MSRVDSENKTLINQDWEILLYHIYKETNSYTNVLRMVVEVTPTLNPKS